MVPYTKVINGLSKYIDEEIVNKLTGLNRWVIGVGAGALMTRATDVFNNLKNNPMIKTMGIINANDEVDVELLYKELKKQAQKGAVTVEVPMVGAMTLNEQDVDKLYNKIMGG